MNTQLSSAPELILASSSRYRRELLARLQRDFRSQSPDIDEAARPGETSMQLVQRLASEKAAAVAADLSTPAIVIGSDQVAVMADEILGKPGNREAAIRQLQRMRGQQLEFLTGLCVLNTARDSRQTGLVPFIVQFRDYTDAEIERYVDTEQPYDCAGSFRSEALGISLVASMSGTDPTALVGLPLIQLCDMLRREGLELP